MVRSSTPKLPKIPAKLARKFLKDEQVAIKQYEALGLIDFAKDEARHAKLFKKILIKKGKEQQFGGK